jgi:hypothetical protein
MAHYTAARKQGNGAWAPSVHHGRDDKLGSMKRSRAGGGMTQARAEGKLGLELGGINGEETPAHSGSRAGEGRWPLAGRAEASGPGSSLATGREEQGRGEKWSSRSWHRSSAWRKEPRGEGRPAVGGSSVTREEKLLLTGLGKDPAAWVSSAMAAGG